jgi:hypothetical protein
MGAQRLMGRERLEQPTTHLKGAREHIEGAGEKNRGGVLPGRKGWEDA